MSGTAQLLTLLLLVAVGAAEHRCTDSSEISCGSSDVDRCIPYRYICDHDPDCGLNGEDEDSDLCAAWRSPDCNRGQWRCLRNGDSTCINIQDYCDPASRCEGDLDPRICQMIEDGEVAPLASITLRNGKPANDLGKSENLAKEFELLLNHTIQHPNCPTMFTLVDDQCVAIFFVGSVSWGEARAFCQVLGGDLISFRDVNHYTSVVSHLREAQMTVDFWVGGSLVNETDGWRWINDTPVEIGTPFWAVRHDERCLTRNVTFPELNQTREANDGTCYNYLQAPQVPPRGHCLSLPYQHYYYMTDEDCLQKKSPLCLLADGETYEDDQGTV